MSCAATIVVAVLSACGGGGRESATAIDSAASASPAASRTATTLSAAVTKTGLLKDIGIADAVATRRTLSASAMLSLTLPDRPVAAAPFARGDGRVFHIDSSSGTDSNDGLSADSNGSSGPWRTLARLLQQADLKAGDSVELACGSVWHETLRLPVGGASGAPVTVAQPVAGCAVPPAIDGSVSLAPAAWTPYQGKIYRAPLADAPLQLLATTGVMTSAHFPVAADVAADPGSPYLALAADSNGAVLTTGADFVLPAGATIDKTTRVHVRTNAWLINESQVAAFDGVHLTLAQAPTYTVAKGWGYFLTGQLWMLRGAGQWYYDAAAMQLYAWMPDSAAPRAPIGVATQAVGIDLHGLSHVVIDGVIVRGVGLGVDLRGTTEVDVRNLRVEDIADIGIVAAGSSRDVVENSSVSRTGADAITGWGGAMDSWLADANALTVRNNVVRESGVRTQGDRVLSLPRRSMAALYLGDAATASGNVVVDSGYIAILAGKDNLVEKNFVYGACSGQDDCGGIYTSGAGNGTRIEGNTIMHSRGFLFGQPPDNRATAAQGIYIDDDGSDILIQSNTVVDADFGLQLHNAAHNVVRSNRFYANRRGQLWMQEDHRTMNPNGDVNANVIDANELAPIAATSVGMLLTTSYAGTAAFGIFTANRYDDRVAPVVVANSTAAASQSLSFARWQGSTGAGSTQPVDLQGTATSRGVTIYRVAGSNLVANGALASDSAGWSSWNAVAPLGQAIRAACPAGMCMRYVAGGSPGVLSSPGFGLTQGAWYRLSVDAWTQTENQSVPLVVRLGSGSYASVADRNLSFDGGTTWARHSVIFQATTTVADADARVDIDGIYAGQSIGIANLEIVPIAFDNLAASSAVVINAEATASSSACPFAGSQPAVCSQLFDLATGAPVAWPVSVPAFGAAILYAREPSLVDSDGDGLADDEDGCPGSKPGTAVNAAGCELVLKPISSRTPVTGKR